MTPAPATPDTPDTPPTPGTEATAELPRDLAEPLFTSQLRLNAALLLVGLLASGYALGRAQPSGLVATVLAVIALGAVAMLGIRMMFHHLLEPLRDLAVKLSRLDFTQRDMVMGDLPTWREDEVGVIARAVQRLLTRGIRDHHDARQLRRTLEDQVRSATQRAVADLSKLAMRDALTDLGNRRHLDEHLPALVESARENKLDLICVLIDLDNFKQVNDTYGHARGDQLLLLLAELLRTSVRAEDMAVRLGGDEFVVFMPGAKLARAAELVQHIRKLFRQQAGILLGDRARADLSVGAASLRQERCGDGGALLAAADRHLYVAKRQGGGLTCSIHGCTAA